VRRHPSTAEAFDWDEFNERELGRHRVRPGEAEALFMNNPRFVRNKKARAATWYMEGRHPTSGRPLKIFITWADEDAGLLRVVTGWSPGERRT